MRGSFCYMPILPARYGAFRAVASLSPAGKSLIAPVFDVPNVVLKANQTIDGYLGKRGREIRRTGLGTAAFWVGYDTNHHLEFVSRQAWNVLKSRDLTRLFSLSEASPQPWLQPELFSL